MSYRHSIVKAYADKIAQDLNGQGYETNLYKNVSAELKHISEINDFPYVCVAPGPETREYQPAGIVWAFFTVFIRVFVQSDNDSQKQLQDILFDLENFVDDNIELEYTIKGQKQNITDAQIESVATDEGLLDPDAVGEIALTVRYERTRF